jgi:hypothetical protein
MEKRRKKIYSTNTWIGKISIYRSPFQKHLSGGSHHDSNYKASSTKQISLNLTPDKELILDINNFLGEVENYHTLTSHTSSVFILPSYQSI